MKFLYDYPFGNDGQSYFSVLARAYNEGHLLDGLKFLWGNKAGSLVLSFHLVIVKLFGFNYSILAFSQFLLTSLQILLLAYLLEFKKIKKILYFLSFLFFLMFATGTYTLNPGGLFDFRFDITGPLFLLLAIVSIPKKNYLTALLFLVAIEERFHNLSILGIVTSVFLIFLVIRDQKSKIKFTTTIKNVLKVGIYPLAGTLFCFLIFKNLMVELVHYYFNTQVDLM
jgi:hypothetical protein